MRERGISENRAGVGAPTAAPAAPAIPERSRTIAALAVTLLFWASAFVAIRYVDRQLSPGPLALLRLLVGTLALGVAVLRRRPPLPTGRALLFTAVSGILWFALYNLALNAGERRIDAGTSSMLVNTGPIFIAVLAGTVLREGFPRQLVVGCAVAFCGTVVIGASVARHGVSDIWGAALCVIAALVYAAGVISQKPALQRTSALAVTWTACAIGSLALMPYTPELIHQLGHAHASTVAWTVYLGLFPTAVGFLAFAYVLTHTSAGRLGSTTYLVPPLVVLIGWIALGEVPPLLAVPGGLLCLGGVAVARR